ncbi:MAG: HAD family hydrolase [Haloferacaceae archaeon]
MAGQQDVRGVVFDLDGTLTPERSYARSGFRAVAKYLATDSEYDAETLFETLWAEYESGRRGDNFDHLLDAYGLDADVTRLVTVYRTHDPDISLHSDAAELLRNLPSDIVTGLVTDGGAAKQWKKISALSLEATVDHIYVSGDFGDYAWKPNPYMFERFLDDAGVSAEHAAYVGDNLEKDFVAPNELGMCTVHVERPEGEYADALPPSAVGEPDVRISNLERLPSTLHLE